MVILKCYSYYIYTVIPAIFENGMKVLQIGPMFLRKWHMFRRDNLKRTEFGNRALFDADCNDAMWTVEND